MERSRVVGALADAIGLSTVVIGAGLSCDPRRFGTLLGLTRVPHRARAVGLVDLALGTAILTSGRAWPRQRWPGLVGREVLHLVIINEYRRLDHTQGVVAMSGLFVVDGLVTMLMFQEETQHRERASGGTV